MARIYMRDGQSVDDLLAIFSREVKKSGVLSTIKKKEFYQKPGLKRKAKDKEALKRKKF